MNALEYARNEAAASRGSAAAARELADAVAGPTLDLFHGVDGIRRNGLDLYQTRRRCGAHRRSDEWRIASVAARDGTVCFWVVVPNFPVEWLPFTPEAFGKRMARFVTPREVTAAPVGATMRGDETILDRVDAIVYAEGGTVNGVFAADPGLRVIVVERGDEHSAEYSSSRWCVEPLADLRKPRSEAGAETWRQDVLGSLAKLEAGGNRTDNQPRGNTDGREAQRGPAERQ